MSIDAAASAPVDSTKLDKKLKKKKKLEHADETIKSKKVKGPKHVEAGPDNLPSDNEKKKRKKEKASKISEQAQELADVQKDGESTRKKRKRHGDALTNPGNADGEVSDKKSKKKKKDKKAKSVGDTEASEKDSNIDATYPLANGPKRSALELGADESSGKKKKKRKEIESVVAADEQQPTPEAGTSKSSVAPEHSDGDISEYLKKHSITMSFGSKHDSMPSNLNPFLSFSDIAPHIPEPLQEAFKTFEEPSPIQACTWPSVLQGRDVVGIAETGSGKTLAFGIPAVSSIVKSRLVSTSEDSSAKSSKKKKSKGQKGQQSQIAVLVLAPTRELAIQTHETLATLGAPFGLKSVAVYGGVPKESQRAALKEEGATMVVGTPGRVIDLMEEGVCDLSGVTYAVLDEADRMLDKGFENDIRSILGRSGSPESRQTLMFSATWPDMVRKLAASFQRNPVRVTVGSDDLTANRRVEQVVEVFEDQREKDSRLIAHLHRLKARKGPASSLASASDESRILVFVLYKKEASRVESTLRRLCFSVGGIHGDLAQSARIAALDAFRSGQTQLLVATDVAARGLDIPNVGTVINYSFPLTVEDYVHRIGRTGRGGRSGKSITFFTGDNHERALAGELAKVLRESGFDAEPLKIFPMSIKKKTHSLYGAFYRDDIPTDAVPTRMKF